MVGYNKAMRDRATSNSRFLSFALRHKPDEVGLVLDQHGWADVDELLACCATQGHAMSLDELRHLVATNDKQRFQLDGNRIRASQGHSIQVELGLEPQTPPAVLFHGTVERFLPSILAAGLEPRSRQHVHLSADVATATVVGGRRGTPVILRVDARAMHQAGQTFWRSANGVWLTDHVAPTCISVLDQGSTQSGSPR